MLSRLVLSPLVLSPLVCLQPIYSLVVNLNLVPPYSVETLRLLTVLCSRELPPKMTLTSGIKLCLR